MSRTIDIRADQASLAFRLRLPEDKQAAPIVMLHGLGGDQKVMWGLESAFSAAGMVVALRSPHAQRQAGYGWNPFISTWPPLVSEFTEAVDLLESLFKCLELQYAFSRDRMLLMDFSNGKAMSFAASMTPMSQSPAGIIAISGHLPAGDLSPLREVPVYWGHGTKDTFIPIDIARSDAERLRQAEVPVTFCEANVGHKLGAQCLNNLRSWFLFEIPASVVREERTP